MPHTAATHALETPPPQWMLPLKRPITPTTQQQIICVAPFERFPDLPCSRSLDRKHLADTCAKIDTGTHGLTSPQGTLMLHINHRRSRYSGFKMVLGDSSHALVHMRKCLRIPDATFPAQAQKYRSLLVDSLILDGWHSSADPGPPTESVVTERTSSFCQCASASCSC